MTTERILIVDDEETLCEVMGLNLGADDYITKPYTVARYARANRY